MMNALVLMFALVASPAEARIHHLLNVRVEVSTQAAIAGKDFPIRVIIRNDAGTPVELPWSKWISQFIVTESFLINGRRAPKTIKHSGLSLGHGKFPGGPIQPGQELSVDLTHVFPVEGAQFLRAKLKLPENDKRWRSFGEIQSEPARVLVKGGA